MKIRIKTIEWGYPKNKEDVIPEVWDLDLMSNSEYNSTFGVLLTLMAQGGLLEMSMTADSIKTLDYMRDLILHVAKNYSVSEEEANTIWLYQLGYECYRQDHSDLPTYYFVNPVPDPDL